MDSNPDSDSNTELVNITDQETWRDICHILFSRFIVINSVGGGDGVGFVGRDRFICGRCKFFYLDRCGFLFRSGDNFVKHIN